MNLSKQYQEISYEGRKRGVVVVREDPKGEGRIGVVIPSLMPFEDPNKPAKKDKVETTSTSGIANPEIASMINTNLQRSNYIWVRPTVNSSGNSRVPYLGANVWVEFEDGDPKKGYYLPYRPTLNGETVSQDTINMASDSFNPSNKPNVHVIETFADGTTIYYNENSGTREYGIKTSDGFEFTIAGNAGKKSIIATTPKGFLLNIDELNQYVQIKTEKDNHVVLSDKEQFIEVKTTGGHLSRLDDKEKKITIQTSGGNSTVMDDGAGTITTQNSGGAKIVHQGSNVMIN